MFVYINSERVFHEHSHSPTSPKMRDIEDIAHCLYHAITEDNPLEKILQFLTHSSGFSGNLRQTYLFLNSSKICILHFPPISKKYSPLSDHVLPADCYKFQDPKYNFQVHPRIDILYSGPIEKVFNFWIQTHKRGSSNNCIEVPSINRIVSLLLKFRNIFCFLSYSNFRNDIRDSKISPS